MKHLIIYTDPLGLGRAYAFSSDPFEADQVARKQLEKHLEKNPHFDVEDFTREYHLLEGEVI